MPLPHSTCETESGFMSNDRHTFSDYLDIEYRKSIYFRYVNMQQALINALNSFTYPKNEVLPDDYLRFSFS